MMTILKYLWRFRAAMGYMQYGELEFIDAWDISKEALEKEGIDSHPVKAAIRDVMTWDNDDFVPCETAEYDAVLDIKI